MEDGGSNRASSGAESASPPHSRESGRGSSVGGRGSGGEVSDMEEDREPDVGSAESGSPEKNDTDSSYD